MKSPVIVYMRHARAIGYCSRGMRRWLYNKEYSWHQFIENGVPASWLRNSGDAMAIKIADFAEMEQDKK